MFPQLLSVAILASASVSALTVPNAFLHRRAHNTLVARSPDASAPATYAEGYLEPYAQYHARYLAIGCQDKHNTTFFNDCCHPMLATETLAANRKPYCAPSASSTPAPQPTTVSGGDDDDDCDDGDDNTPSSQDAPAPTQPPQEAAPAPPAPTTEAPAPAPTTDTPAPAPTSDAPAPAPDSGSNVNTGGVATWYTQDGTAGACGDYHSDSDFVVAMDQDRYGDSGARSNLCGKNVQITNSNNGKSVIASVADSCPSCNGPNSIDLSVATFQALDDLNTGEFPITWSFV